MANKPPVLKTSDLDAEQQLLAQNATIAPIQNVFSLSVSADKGKQNAALLAQLLTISAQLEIRKQSNITFSEPILKRADECVIYPNTVNMLQGQMGVHKSRIIEMMCAAVLRKANCENLLLGFAANTADLKVLYIDTERNLSEQFPAALQRIQLAAGYTLTEETPNFCFSSLLTIERQLRFDALAAYLAYMQAQSDVPIFVVLDVVSDCITDFNRADCSMQLIDMLNLFINTYNVTFMVVLHENFGSDKARGHLGSELYNKCSTVLQIAAEKDGAGEATNLFKVKYIKCRNTKRYEPYFVCYDDTTKGLVLADKNAVRQVQESRQIIALINDVCAELEKKLSDQAFLGTELVTFLCDFFKTSDKTIKERLQKIEDERRTLYWNNREMVLHKSKKRNANVYSLKSKNQLQNQNEAKHEPNSASL